MTVFEAANKQWKLLNDAGLNPQQYMEPDHFEMAKDYMRKRLRRMWKAMLTVFIDWDREMLNTRGIELTGLEDGFIDWWFFVSKNRVWDLIKDDKGLTRMRLRVEDWLLVTERNGHFVL